MYKVLSDFKVKVQGEIKAVSAGSVINLPEAAAKMFVQQGKIELVGGNPEPDDERSISDIEKAKIDCVFAQQRLSSAEDLYYRALDASREALGQLVYARRNFDAVKNRLRVEATCGEIQDYLRGFGVGKN